MKTLSTRTRKRCPSIYGSTEGGLRIQGELSREGRKRFMAVAAKLKKQLGRPAVSQANVVEYAMRELTPELETQVGPRFVCSSRDAVARVLTTDTVSE